MEAAHLADTEAPEHLSQISCSLEQQTFVIRSEKQEGLAESICMLHTDSQT